MSEEMFKIGAVWRPNAHPGAVLGAANACEFMASPISRTDSTAAESRFAALVQSPLRAGLLRFLHARPNEAFEVEALMQTFGRMRLDIENCLREVVDFGVARRLGRHASALRGLSS